jgi:hypothetical protein
VLPDQLVQPALLVLPDHKAYKAKPDLQDHKVLQVYKVLQVQQALPDHKAFKAKPDHKVLQVQQALPDHKVQLVLQDQLVKRLFLGLDQCLLLGLSSQLLPSTLSWVLWVESLLHCQHQLHQVAK